MDTREFIGRKINSARKEKGWSVRELARRYDISHATISRWESGKQQVDIRDLERIANILEKPLQWFLPEWYIDPRELPPEVARIANQLNDFPAGPQKDQLLKTISEILKTVMPEDS